jgi:Na+/H+-dicarboxylate symporter
MKGRSRQLLLIGMLAGMVGGAFAGWFMGLVAVTWFGWMGEFFLRCLKMLIVPLILFSMITGVASLGDVRRLGRPGATTLAYYLSTTAIAVLLGIILVNVIQPGASYKRPEYTADEQAKIEQLEAERGQKSFVETLQDMALTLVTPNLIEAMAQGNNLPLIVFAIIFGAILTTLGEPGLRATRTIETLNDATIKFIRLVIMVAPIGIFGLVAAKLGATGGGAAFWAKIKQVGSYTLTVIIGLIVHGVVILPLILWLLTRRNPLVYAGYLARALTTAFTTGSSAATLPVTMENVETGAGVGKRSSRFVLPLGATVNMDGTALYEAVAVIFIAQSYGVELTAAHQFIIFLTATLAAIGAAAIPEAGLVTMVLVLTSVKLPVEGIGLILAVDWFLDRCRTTVNVWGDAVGAAVVDRLGFKEPPPVPVAVTEE